MGIRGPREQVAELREWGSRSPPFSQTGHLPDPSVPSHPGSLGPPVAEAGVAGTSLSLASFLLLSSYVFGECRLTLASA